MTDRELMQMALEWIEAQNEPRMIGSFKITKALRDRLAQPEPEPVAWIAKDRSSIEVSIMSAEYMMAQGFEPLYTAPPKREWVGLTETERNEILFNVEDDGEPWPVMRAVEAKLKQKNEQQNQP